MVIFSVGLVYAQDAPAENTTETTSETAAPETIPAEPPAPAMPAFSIPTGLAVADVKNDAGRAIVLTWDKPEKGTENAAATLLIWRMGGKDSDWVQIGDAPITQGKYTDAFSPATDSKPEHSLKDGTEYSYKISIEQFPQVQSQTMTAVSSGQWFNTRRTSVLVATAIYVFFVAFFIRKARTGKRMYVRPIAGITAVEEAVGRATEMGKPVLYIPGIGEIQEVATLAALTILSPITQKVAEYNTPILVPNRDPVVFTVAQEVVREAYLKAGAPDAYKEDNIFFLSGRQFAYAAAVSGIMMREKPGTNFFFGTFYAESLILAETGAATGAIQIAGTDQVAQLPFFIAACDYTLIGEELYAASAYLSDDPVLVGSLKALDWAKIVIFGYLAVGLITGMFGIRWLAHLL